MNTVVKPLQPERDREEQIRQMLREVCRRAHQRLAGRLVNRKTATALGISVPLTILLRADEVIK